jgi:MtN3 and saliva related transmembrane protein
MRTVLGLAAATLTTGCWLPQLIRSWRTRSVSDLSWLYLLALTVGVSLWLIYGLVSRDVVIVLANAATLAALGTISTIKIRSEPRPRPAVQR